MLLLAMLTYFYESKIRLIIKRGKSHRFHSRRVEINVPRPDSNDFVTCWNLSFQIFKSILHRCHDVVKSLQHNSFPMQLKGDY